MRLHASPGPGASLRATTSLGKHDLAIAGVSVTGPVGRSHPARHASAVHAAAASIASTLARRAQLS